MNSVPSDIALRRENRKLKEEREILSKAAAWFATESGTSKRSSGS
jgi:transposase